MAMQENRRVIASPNFKVVGDNGLFKETLPGLTVMSSQLPRFAMTEIISTSSLVDVTLTKYEEIPSSHLVETLIGACCSSSAVAGIAIAAAIVAPRKIVFRNVAACTILGSFFEHSVEPMTVRQRPCPRQDANADRVACPDDPRQQIPSIYGPRQACR